MRELLFSGFAGRNPLIVTGQMRTAFAGVLRRSTERKETAPLPAVISFIGNLMATMRGLLSSASPTQSLIVAFQGRAGLSGLKSGQPRIMLSSASAFWLFPIAMKQLFAIVALAVILGTMYGYVLGRLEFGPPVNPQAPAELASEYPTFLLGGNLWEKIIFWSAPPLFALFAWLTIKFVGQTYLRDQKARLHECTFSDMGDLFRKLSPLLHQKPGSNGNSHEPGR